MSNQNFGLWLMAVYTDWALRQRYDEIETAQVQGEIQKRFAEFLCIDPEKVNEWLDEYSRKPNDDDLFLLSYSLGEQVWPFAQDEDRIRRLAAQVAHYRGVRSKDFLKKVLILANPDAQYTQLLNEHGYWNLDRLSVKQPAWVMDRVRLLVFWGVLTTGFFAVQYGAGKLGIYLDSIEQSGWMWLAFLVGLLAFAGMVVSAWRAFWRGMIPYLKMCFF